MRDRALREKLGHAGRERVCENYDYRLVAERFVELIGAHLGVS
jgi:starch synthase